MNKYKCLIFDVDNTILDYDACATRSLYQLFHHFGLECNNEIDELFTKICYDEWTKFGLNNLCDANIQNHYHDYYELYNTTRFETLKNALAERSLKDISVHEMSDAYSELFNNTTVFVKDAEDVLETCAKKHIVAAATNGLSVIQRGRLAPVSKYLSHMFISEEMKCVKPQKEYYRYMLNELDLPVKDCLFIGDLYTTDIQGALSFGMDACWFRQNSEKSEKWLEATDVPRQDVTQIHELKQLYDYI
ncbi:MAG: HAD family hydrolase [Clostridia bacterium]